MLEAIDITKQFGAKLALDKVSLSVSPGDIYCLLGANGAGKTTLINLFLNFLQPTSGSLQIGKLDVAQDPLETKRLLAYIPEQVTLYAPLSGLENLLSSPRSRSGSICRGSACWTCYKRRDFLAWRPTTG